GAVADAQGGGVDDGATEGEADLGDRAAPAGAAVAAAGQIVGEGAVADAQHGAVVDGAAICLGDVGVAAAGAAGAADGLVAGERAVADDEEGPRDVVVGAAPGGHAGSADGPVAGHHDVRQGQDAAVVEEAAARVGPAVAEGQAVEGHADAAADLEDSAGVV